MKRYLLVSCASLSDDRVFGMVVRPRVLAQRMLPPDPKKIGMREDWRLNITGASGDVIAGDDVASLEPRPQLTFAGNFESNFPPWRLNIWQTDVEASARQFRLRTGIYVFSVLVVVAALFFGGYLAIRSTAKELNLAAMKSDFVSTVSHEFRTPLMSIRYLAELLQRGRVPDEGRKQQYYETITQESDRLGSLVENILDFSRIESGTKKYRMEETDVAALADDVARRFRRQAGLHDFTLETDIAGGMPLVSADKEALSRALFNLLDNAVKYSAENSKVVLRVRDGGAHVFLEVEDHGIGIDPKERRKVFEKFYRSDRALAVKIRGSGIGLTLVEHIVKAHGGTVLLESGENAGTKVTLRLPVQERAESHG